MTPTEFQLRQYVIRLKGLALHYIPDTDLKRYDGLFNAIEATFEEMDSRNKHMMKKAREVHNPE